jgi:hypothetical protein
VVTPMTLRVLVAPQSKTTIAAGISECSVRTSDSAIVWRPRHSRSAIGTGLVDSSLDRLGGVWRPGAAVGPLRVEPFGTIQTRTIAATVGVVERLSAGIRDELRRLQSLQYSPQPVVNQSMSRDGTTGP